MVAATKTRLAPLGRLCLLAVAWAASAVAWAMGALLNPSIEVHVLSGTRFERTFTRSLMGTLQELLHHQRFVAFAVLGFFSVALPAVKLTATFFLACRLCGTPLRIVHSTHRGLVWALTSLASYQLLDFYVGVLVVAFFNSDTAQAEALSGFYWFFGYCVASLVSSELMSGLFGELPLTASLGAEHHDSFTQLPAVWRQLGEDDDDAGGGGGYVAGCGRGGRRSVSRPVLHVGATLLSVVGFAALLFSSTWSGAGPLLEVRAMWSGVALDRRAFGATELLHRALPELTGPFVAVPVVLMNLVFPALYTLALLLSCCLPTSRSTACLQNGGSCWSSCLARCGDVCESAGSILRPWSTIDVAALSVLIFMMTVQDAHTLTMTPAGSSACFLFLGAGLAFFFLRWCVWRTPAAAATAEATAEGEAAGLHLLPRHVQLPLLLVVAWLAVSWVIYRGVPGSAPHFVFPTLDSVCEQVLPVFDRTMRHMAPASFGDCNYADAPAPAPCTGKEMLVNHAEKSGFIQAPWVSGIDTLHFDRCHLVRRAAGTMPASADDRVLRAAASEFQLTIGGVFKHVDLFLHLKKCGLLGQCAHMNSTGHCCGDDLRFELRFGMGCRPGLGGSAEGSAWNITLDDLDLDPMPIQKQLLDRSWVSLVVDAVDISPRVEKVVKEHLRGFISGARIHWSRRDLQVPQLLNELIGYNSPAHVGEC